MKKVISRSLVLLLGLCSIILVLSCSSASSKGELVWEENFKNDSLDSGNWSKIPRGTPDWKNYMSPEDTLYALRDNKLILRGMENKHVPQDTAQFLTGGVYTKDKQAFGHGRWEVRAKLNGAEGAWPALWLLPQTEDRTWPDDGEIDIMERLSHSDTIYQTVHSYYTQKLGIQDDPQHSATTAIDPEEFNTYAVEIHSDKVVYFINDEKIMSYPKIETDKKGQFPYSDHKFYILLDMQLGGDWVGEVDSDELPVEMEIDWVKFYKF